MAENKKKFHVERKILNTMDFDQKKKYEGYKKTVKQWEMEFRKKNDRIPSPQDMKEAPLEIKQAYEKYHKMKTKISSDILSDVLDDEAMNDSDQIDMSQMSESSVHISKSIGELLDPYKALPIEVVLDKKPVELAAKNLREFEATDHLPTNDNAWNENLNKPQTRRAAKVQAKPTIKKMSINVGSATVKPLRNPRKPLKLKLASSSTLIKIQNDDFPEYETIMLERSRSNAEGHSNSIATPTPTSSDIKTVDLDWLDRHTSVLESTLPKSLSSVTSTSSFGLSNLKMHSFNSVSSLHQATQGTEIKYHASDMDVVENSDDDDIQTNQHLVHIAKKRRIYSDDICPTVEPKESAPMDVTCAERGTVLALRKKVPEKPKRKSQRMTKSTTEADQIDETIQTPQAEQQPDNDDPYNGPAAGDTTPRIKRKPSVIKRLKNRISKLAEKAKTRGKKSTNDDEEEVREEEEDEINFLIDSDLNAMTTVPRASQKELKNTEQLFDDYLKQNEPVKITNKTIKIIDSKTAAKKELLAKKIAAGTLNDNYVRVNLRKKVFVRGKKAFSLSKYKKSVWKTKKAAALSGPEMDMGGCDGGVLKCFNCGGVGHFAQQCKQKGDKLLPADIDVPDESLFPTLAEAAQMANEQKMLAHCSNVDKIPQASNEMWKSTDEASSDDDSDNDFADKENKDGNSEVADVPVNPVKSYIGSKIPEDFLKKSGLLEMTAGNLDQIHPLYELNADGSLPPTPKEVIEALKMFGHEGFRPGQEAAIMRVLCGVSTLVTLSTGSGKSLCYQLPAFLFRKKNHCITLVISPLVSLMEDQIHGIPEFINARCLHTNQTKNQRKKTIDEIKAGKVEILLVSPEAVVSGEKSAGFGSILRDLPPIAFACIDEAHCVSQWSHNFRPSYLMICRVLREKLGVKTVLGLTATATLQTRESIVYHLGIPDGLSGIISDTPLPDNLVLTISHDEYRDRALIALLHGERFASLQSIIIYCTRRDECERIAGYLRTLLQEDEKNGIKLKSKKRKRNENAAAYHAGLAAYQRRTIQRDFMKGELRIVVATIAFGMGINKSDIRGIIHYNMPKSFESYVQEVGRAGRDGLPAHCHVFLDAKGNDLSELRRHIYSNSIDRHVISKLLRKVFVACSCAQYLKHITDPETKRQLENVDLNEFFESDNVDGSDSANGTIAKRLCSGHEVAFSVDETIQALDIPQENISTLLCYLELHEQRYIKVLGIAYTKCKIISYGGARHLKQVAKTCPPLAMAIAMDLKKETREIHELASIEFFVVEVAAAIGWDSGVVKHQLKQLENTTVNGDEKRSMIAVSFSDLGFRIRSPGDLTDPELDSALESLENRTSSQERSHLIQLQIIFNTFKSLAFPKVAACSTHQLPVDESDQLKVIIRNYFQSNLSMDVELADETNETTDNELKADIRTMISIYPDNNFNGRNLARIFHGITSPCYPAVIWGRCKYWRAHIAVSFNRIVTLANRELVKMRRNE